MPLINSNLVRTMVTKGKDAIKSNITNDSRFADQLAMIKRWTAQKQQQTIITDELVAKLFDNVETLGDETEIHYKNFDNDEDVKFISEVNNTVLDDIIEGFDTASSRWQQAFGADLNNSGFTLSDASGYCYCFIKGSYNIELPDGTNHNVYGLSMVTDPHDYHDMFIYRVEDTNKCFVNPIVKSVGYYRLNGGFYQINSIYKSLTEIADLIDADDYYGSIVAYINYLANSRDETIYTASVLLCESYDLVDTGTIYGNVNACVNYLSTVWQRANTGIRKYAGDIYRGIAVNGTILEVYNYISDGLFSNKLSEIIGNLRYKFSDVASSVKKVINDISDAFAVGGFYGVICYFISIIKGESSIHSNGEKLNFTDNDSLAPAQYIAGVVMTMIGTVAQAASLVVTAISKIAGALLAVVGSILLAIPKAFGYDYSTNTKAAVNDGNQFVMDCCPHATMQYEFLLDTVQDEFINEIYQLVTDTASSVYCQVPGGYLFFGKGNVEQSLRCEFHPSSRAVRFTAMSKLFITTDVQKTATWKTAINWKVTADSLNPDKLAEAWKQDYENNSFVIQNGDNGLLSDWSDEQLRQIVITNSAVFYTYLWLISGRIPMGALNNIISVKWSDWTGNVSDPVHIDFTLGPDRMLPWFLNACRWPQGWFNSTGPLCTWTELANLFSSANARQASLHVIGWVQDISHWTDYPTSGDFDVSYGGVLRLYNMFNQYDFFYGTIVPTPNEYVYYFSTPKYERATFVAWVALATFVTVVATVAAVVTAVKVKKAIQNKRAKLTAKVSNDWENYTNSLKDYDENDPDDRPEYHTAQARQDAYKSYFKSVKKNNRWQMVLGGTKYSTAGYWDSDQSISPDDIEGSSIFTAVKDTIGSETDSFNTKDDLPEDYTNNLNIYEAITGKSL